MRSREAGGWFFPAVCVVCALLSAVIAVSALGGASGYTDAVNSLVTPVQAGVSKLWNSARDAAAQDRAQTPKRKTRCCASAWRSWRPNLRAPRD